MRFVDNCGVSLLIRLLLDEVNPVSFHFWNIT